MTTDPFQIAVFPIPGMVCFPGHRVSLHVFESRYRKMVRDCLDAERPLGVCLPDGTVTDKDSRYAGDTKQELFQPRSIFGAGTIGFVETLNDGRFFIEVDISQRVEIKKIIQEVPYFVADVVAIDDSAGDPREVYALFRQLRRLSRLALGKHFVTFEKQIHHEILENSDLSAFTFEVFKWCQLEAEQMQVALECTDPIMRAKLLVDCLELYLASIGRSTARTPGSPRRILRGPVQSDNVIRADFARKLRLS